jgi:hypothetical protein
VRVKVAHINAFRSEIDFELASEAAPTRQFNRS